MIEGVKILGRVSTRKADTSSYKDKGATHTIAVGKKHDKSVVSAAENQEKFSKYVFLCKNFHM